MDILTPFSLHFVNSAIKTIKQSKMERISLYYFLYMFLQLCTTLVLVFFVRHIYIVIQ